MILGVVDFNKEDYRLLSDYYISKLHVVHIKYLEECITTHFASTLYKGSIRAWTSDIIKLEKLLDK